MPTTMRPRRNKQNQYSCDSIVNGCYTPDRGRPPSTANDIRPIGVQLDTGDPYEGGRFVGPLEAILHVDSITAQ
jgi:hypothetical protein